jgi:hypothetical protein
MASKSKKALAYIALGASLAVPLRSSGQDAPSTASSAAQTTTMAPLSSGARTLDESKIAMLNEFKKLGVDNVNLAQLKTDFGVGNLHPDNAATYNNSKQWQGPGIYKFDPAKAKGIQAEYYETSYLTDSKQFTNWENLLAGCAKDIKQAPGSGSSQLATDLSKLASQQGGGRIASGMEQLDGDLKTWYEREAVSKFMASVVMPLGPDAALDQIPKLGASKRLAGEISGRIGEVSSMLAAFNSHFGGGITLMQLSNDFGMGEDTGKPQIFRGIDGWHGPGIYHFPNFDTFGISTEQQLKNWRLVLQKGDHVNKYTNVEMEVMWQEASPLARKIYSGDYKTFIRDTYGLVSSLNPEGAQGGSLADIGDSRTPEQKAAYAAFEAAHPRGQNPITNKIPAAAPNSDIADNNQPGN